MVLDINHSLARDSAGCQSGLGSAERFSHWSPLISRGLAYEPVSSCGIARPSGLRSACPGGLEWLGTLWGLSLQKVNLGFLPDVSCTLRFWVSSLKSYAKLHVHGWVGMCVLRAQVPCFYQIPKGIHDPKTIENQNCDPPATDSR